MIRRRKDTRTLSACCHVCAIHCSCDSDSLRHHAVQQYTQVVHTGRVQNLSCSLGVYATQTSEQRMAYSKKLAVSCMSVMFSGVYATQTSEQRMAYSKKLAVPCM